MIVAHVRFPVDFPDLKELEDKMVATIPKYEGLDGLIRKYYMISDDGKQAGGIYLWESREKADAWYTADWKKAMTAAWGETPLLEYLDCPIVVDNDQSKVLTKDAA